MSGGNGLSGAAFGAEYIMLSLLFAFVVAFLRNSNLVETIAIA